ncbi:tetratricopeptide repeat protein [Litoribrevibacter euphylliae]|uniref:Tetratricopeptide repeat protein n=1 Tax=Litoribrevibacter euphylliae TaxID=1834034 RepID=A0ABV7HJY7_9GAMM
MRHILWSAIILLSGCATFNTTTQEQTDPTTNTVSQTKTAKEHPTRPFETDTLYNLLVAEIAGQRSQYDLALSYYLDEAKNTRDPNVAARASRIAQYLNEPQAAAEAADIWRENDKENIHAHVTAANNWLKQQDIEKSIQALRDALAISESISLEQIYLSGKELPAELHQSIIDGLSSLISEHPNHVRLHFTKALLLSDFGQDQQALEAMKALTQAGEMSPPHYIMLAKLYARNEQAKDSLRTLEEGWNNFTGEKTLGLLYAQALADHQEVDDALDILEVLTEIHPSDDEILISAALINAELGQYKAAEALFLSATETKQRDSAWYFLGQLHEQHNQPEQAIEAYKSVEEGKNLISAITRTTTLIKDNQDINTARQYLRELHTQHANQIPRLIQIEAELVREANDFNESIILYNEAIALEPSDGNLLYGRAMVRDMTGDIQGMEQDLRAILAKNPNSSIALNALGYTLADKTDRLEEAKDYIEKAYILDPNDPAIIDSLGWIYFKLGDYKKAELLLAKAYQMFKDQEVAAHLGEVLWVQNKKDQALKVWIDGLRHNPTGPKLLETMKRFNINVNHKDDQEPAENESPTTQQ